MSEIDDIRREKLDMINQEGPNIDDFLRIISQIESTGGQNLDHPEIKHGIQAGSQAMGRYGLMPNTVKELTNRAERQGSASDEMRSFASIEDPQEMKAALEANQPLETQYAEQLAKKVLMQFPDEEQAAYSWNQGHNLRPEAVQKRGSKNHPYVQKFRKLRSLVAGK
jgi:hypothetical protein